MISVRSVHKRFGGVTALDGVTLERDAGTTVILGPNGAGKTTLLRCLATVMRPDAGEIQICSVALGHERDNRRARGLIGYMPQALGFFPGFTLRQHLDRVAVLKRITDKVDRSRQVDRVLQTVGLESLAGEKIRRLSGGMQRRLGLAQALIGSPPVLILDEPSAGLDPQQRVAFRSIVGLLGSSGTSILISTHQIEDLLGVSGSVVVLAEGRVAFDGTPDVLARLAKGSVWLTDDAPPGSVSWPTPDGRFRVLGKASGQPIEPTVEDGYLMLLQQIHAG